MGRPGVYLYTYYVILYTYTEPLYLCVSTVHGPRGKRGHVSCVHYYARRPGKRSEFPEEEKVSRQKTRITVRDSPEGRRLAYIQSLSVVPQRRVRIRCSHWPLLRTGVILNRYFIG